MAVPISKFRNDIFSSTEAALKGAVVEFTHKGVTFKVVPEQSIDKISNVTPLQVINPALGDGVESGRNQLALIHTVIADVAREATSELHRVAATDCGAADACISDE